MHWWGRTEAKRDGWLRWTRGIGHLPYYEQWCTAWPLLSHRPPLTPAKLHNPYPPLPTTVLFKGTTSHPPRQPGQGADPRLPTPNFLLQPPSPSTEAHRTLQHLLTLQNNTLIMIKSAATSFVDFCRNFAGERMAEHDSKHTEWHLIFSKPSLDFS